MSLYVCESVCVSVCLCRSVCLRVSQCMCMSVCLFECMCVCLCVFVAVELCSIVPLFPLVTEHCRNTRAFLYFLIIDISTFLYKLVLSPFGSIKAKNSFLKSVRSC